jgi:hypothetical protein
MELSLACGAADEVNLMGFIGGTSEMSGVICSRK